MKTSGSIRLFALTLVLVSVASGWVSGPGKGCFKIVSSQQLTWEHAQAVCKSEGGFGLAVLDSHERVVFMSAYVKSTVKNYEEIGGLWLGGSIEGTNGLWVWYKANSVIPVQYSDWAPGQPDQPHREKCLVLHTSSRGGPYTSWMYKWNDAPCDIKLGYICEYDDSKPVIG